MSGINNIMDIARKGLFASQAAIEVTGQNISNVNTVGYSRRYVRLEESLQLDYRPGQIGMGVEAAEVLRHFDRFIETNYLDKSTMQQRYDTLFGSLKSVDSLLYESEKVGGISSYLSQFFGDWQKLTSETDNYAVRETLLSDTNNLLSVIHQADAQMTRMQEQANQFIQQDVDDVNRILEKIAGINGQLKQVEIPGQNNANALRDDRDRLVRELAGKLDINVITRGNEQDFTITTKAGHTLLQNEQTFSLKFEGPRVTSSLVAGSTFGADGKLYFDGMDDFEYTIDFVSAGTAGSEYSGDPTTAAMFRVSLDGGKTWLKDDNGVELQFPAGDEAHLVEVRGVKIWFGQQGSSTTPPSNGPEVGDDFIVAPKSGVYWYQDTSTSENITPQIYANGEDNNRRITGGSLAGFFNFRDNYIGQYRDKLDALAKELIWSVNSIHSEGAGLKKLSEATGTYQVFDSTVPLANDTSGLFFRDKLQSGNLQFYAYDNTGAMVGTQSLDFTAYSSKIPPDANFDPEDNSLEDVRDAFNDMFASMGLAVPADMQASIVNGSLRIASGNGHTFGFGQDSTGLLAGLGINTYFSGTSARSIEINSAVASNTSLINAGHYNGAGEINEGDNLIASDIAALKDKKLDIHTDFGGTAHQTLSEFYNALVSSVGGDTSSAQFNFSYQNSLAQDLDAQQQSLSGVNLDEEMSNLIKFQHSYTAAAKLISTADQMLQTLLGLKP
ncbi:flagellar hook-associated protein FlgK [Desulfocurvibacter africanus]|uniref:Flagellar hook-associated protein 1 n=1 Tax=Desulfocurvibacter africanus subsp. africanus str. Walvis Bay TaxID=690850 RepID=F3YZI1_DESAF|nr:flagellar hook-associated protein FlgK [Desulfocurvibacter africanus]EGJ52010.1 flagellar hook-associated protein FlgK [Desulfocurvibacter africanus subsp. africanus str. Walvis Bay]